MEVRLLGPLEVWDEGQALQVRGTKRRAVLALLALHAGEVVRSERLIEELWGERPPANAAAALHNHISRLRKELGSEVVATRPWGYVLRVEPEAIDLRRFEALLGQAKPLPARERREVLAEALALWRGPALADLVNEPALELEIPRLEELHLAALEARIDADLELGAHEELVPELEALIASHPLSERLRGQLILALYRSGRQAEALETYRETRRLLVEELGLEPSPELRELERAILCQDPALASVAVPVAAEPPPPERWHWPRSPLAFGAGLIALGLAGTALAIALTRGDSPGTADAAPGELVAVASMPTWGQPKTAAAVVATHPHVAPPATRPKPKPTTTASLVHHVVATPKAQAASHTSPPAVQPSPPPPPAPPPPPPPPTPPAQPALVFWLADSFTSPDFDPARWNLRTDNKAAMASERNGRLELTIDPARAPANRYFDTHYESQCEVAGDFDARVDYKLVTWGEQNGVNVMLSAWFPDDAQPTFVARTGQGASGGYSFEAYSTGLRNFGTGIQTGDSEGSLRITRKDGWVATYYRYENRWIELAARHEVGWIRLLLGVDANVGEFGFQPTLVAFDNFTATAARVNCHGFPDPPLKRRRP